MARQFLSASSRILRNPHCGLRARNGSRAFCGSALATTGVGSAVFEPNEQPLD